VSHLSKVECDEKFAVKIIIRGMSITEYNIADVIFDMLVRKPDGNVSEESVNKDLSVYQSEVLVAENIYNNEVVPVVSFDSAESFGLYSVEVLVKDNIGNRNVALTRQIELVSCVSET